MKNNFREQFENLRTIIETNVATLRSLLKQSEQLSELVQKIQNSEKDNELKKQLVESKTNITTSIDVLVGQTQNLFKVYENLVDEVFGR